MAHEPLWASVSLTERRWIYSHRKDADWGKTSWRAFGESLKALMDVGCDSAVNVVCSGHDQGRELGNIADAGVKLR